MNNEHWLLFLHQKALLRYGIIFILYLLIVFILYYFFIIPINNQYNNAQLTYQTLIQNITQLEQQISRYPEKFVLEKEQQSLTQLLQQNHFTVKDIGNMMTNLLIACHLKLIDFHREEGDKKRQVNLQLQGNYYDFLQFIAQLSQLTLAIKIINLSINQNNKQLMFTLSIISEYKSMEE